MRSWGQKQLGVLSLVLAGTMLGTFAGFWLGRAMLLRSARIMLSDYAGDLARHAEDIGDELLLLSRKADARRLPYCSSAEISILQGETFQSSDLKDIGRTHTGKLDCSAFLGHLARPYSEGPPTLVLQNGTRVYTNVAVLLASAEGNRGTIIEFKGLDAVLNPNSFERETRANTRYMVAAINRQTRQIAIIAGTTLKLDLPWILSQGSKISSGVLYHTTCSELYEVCAVTAESVADIWGGSRAMETGYSALGGLAGLGLGFALALLYRQNCGIGHQLHRAIRKNSSSLRLVYEPIFDPAMRRYSGAEALLRWSDEDGDSVPPDVFIGLAEEKGFIGELTALVVRRAIGELGDFLRRNRHFTLSINIAASDLKTDRLFALLEENVLSSEIERGQIALELTERSTADLATVRGAIQRFSRSGYKVYIDDFGTGFSSLSYLDQLAVHAIKIDRAFTRTIGTDALTAPILPHILEMVGSLGMALILEGVETGLQMDYLLSTGKPLRLQGWYFSRPLAGPDLCAFCERLESVPLLVADHSDWNDVPAAQSPTNRTHSTEASHSANAV